MSHSLWHIHTSIVMWVGNVAKQMRHKHNGMSHVKQKCKLCSPFKVEKGRGDQSLLKARKICKMLKLRTIMYGPFKGPNAYTSQRAGP